MTTELIIVLVGVAVILIGLGVWYFARRKTTERLRERFGPEYDKTVSAHHNQQRAEAELSKREERVRKFNIVALPRDERVRYQENWLLVQSRFVDQPESALAEANSLVREVMQRCGYSLVREVMQRCGYPLTDFEQSAADISVDHPHVVENFRAATRIAERSKTSAASTEELRQAIIHYRALFDDLLQTEEADVSSNKNKRVWTRNGKSSRVQPNH
jgi:hypothetical protein